MDSDNKKQLYLLYSLNFFKDLNLINVLLSPLVLASGLTVGDYLITLSAFRITQTLFSIPCGVLSDYLSPRRNLQIASFLYFISFLCLFPETKNLENFLLYNIISAVSVCFLLASSNKHLKNLVLDKDVFINKYASKISLRKLASMFSGVVASFILLTLSYQGVLYLQLLFAGGVFVLSLYLTPPQKTTTPRPPFLNLNVREMMSILKNTSFFSVLAVAIPFFISVDIMLQPLILKLNLPQWTFPLAVASANFLIFYSINQSRRVVKVLPKNPAFSSLMSFSPFVLYALTHSALWALAGITLTILSRSTSIIEMGKFLNEVPPHRQGAMESILNTTLMILVGTISLIFGLLVKKYSFYDTNLIVGTVLLLVFVIGPFLLKKPKAVLKD